MGSTFYGVAINSMSWYYNHVVCVFLLFWAMYEYLNKERFLLIGFILAFLLASRSTVALASIFFILEIIRSQSDLKTKLTQSSYIILPVIISLLMLMQYNFIRFGNYFDNGYMSTIQHDRNADRTRTKYGLFNIVHIPSNLYNYILRSPEPVYEPNTYRIIFPYIYGSFGGTSFLLTSSLFVTIFFGIITNKRNIHLWVSSIVILLSLLTYAYTGASQYGTRYMLDLLPIWYIILLEKYKHNNIKEIPLSHILLIIFSSTLNIYLYFARFLVL